MPLIFPLFYLVDVPNISLSTVSEMRQIQGSLIQALYLQISSGVSEGSTRLAELLMWMSEVRILGSSIRTLLKQHINESLLTTDALLYDLLVRDMNINV